jgi:hypothetical protein
MLPILSPSFSGPRGPMTARARGSSATPLYFVFGLLFSLAYYATFLALGRSGWALGAVFGLLHALFAGTTLVNLLLPLVYPRMGTSMTAAYSAPLLEPPGFMLLNYGRATPTVTILAHLAYGAIVGVFAKGPG